MRYSAKGLAYTNPLYQVAIMMIINEFISTNNKKHWPRKPVVEYLPQITYKVTTHCFLTKWMGIRIHP